MDSKSRCRAACTKHAHVKGTSLVECVHPSVAALQLGELLCRRRVSVIGGLLLFLQPCNMLRGWPKSFCLVGSLMVAKITGLLDNPTRKREKRYIV
jgi:hypothetical protein